MMQFLKLVAVDSAAPPQRHLARWIVAGLAVLFFAFTFQPVVEGDGVGYYAYLHAVLVSHSLDFTTEYAAAIASHTPLYLPLVSTRTAAGHLANFFSVGPALLAAPAYLVALAMRSSGDPQYGSPFLESFTVASLLYCLIGLAISYRLASSVVINRRSALMGVLAAFFATPLYYYALTDPSYSHTFSVFCVSAFLYAWWKGPPETRKGWFGLGVLGGLMAMGRFQDGLLVALVLIDFRRLRWPALMLLPGLLVGFAPQLVVDQVQFGTWLPQRPAGQALDPFSGRYFEVLFSSRDGLLVWTPLAMVAAAGFIWVKDRRLKIAAVLAFVLEVAVTGAAPDSVGAAFGPRRFLDLIPFAVVGMAALADRLGPRLDWAVVAALGAWNLTLVANFEYVFGLSQDPGHAGLVRQQLPALQYLPRLFAKGAVIRDLLLWRQAHLRFDPLRGVALLALEAACVAAAWSAALWSRAPRSQVKHGW
ncbi:MAG: hypothetical protein PVS3B2_15870 [Candidatus Dormibacteraceae bacterium]